MQKLIEVVLLDPGFVLVAIATWTPASIILRASGYGCRVEKSVAGRKVATVLAAGQRLDVGVVEVGAVIDRGGSHLDRQPDAGSGAELVAMHPQAEPGRRAGVEHRA